MPGRYGNKSVFVKNLEIVSINESKNQLLIKEVSQVLIMESYILRNKYAD